MLIFDGKRWAVVLNADQGLLGRCFCLLKRPETDLTALDEDETTELWHLLRRTRAALAQVFAPDHFNFSALMNQDPQVHFHVVPRYKTDRLFEGVTFTDPSFGGHYTVAPPFVLTDTGYANVLDTLRAAFV